MDYKTNYESVNMMLSGVIEDCPHRIANMANASAVLFQELKDLNWAGFYLYEGGKLVLGPFQGKVACIEIELGRGVCGTAAEKRETVLVPDVHQFAGHIACDGASNSEIVVPIVKDGQLLGVLDIDSPVLNRFSKEDQVGLEKFVEILKQGL
ncbi:MAG: GAF domain-containing protein [Acetatifactor sp.]|nr:GAF domain-containing protein [Acetatifactor sp.]